MIEYLLNRIQNLMEFTTGHSIEDRSRRTSFDLKLNAENRLTCITVSNLFRSVTFYICFYVFSIFVIRAPNTTFEVHAFGYRAFLPFVLITSNATNAHIYTQIEREREREREKETLRKK